VPPAATVEALVSAAAVWPEGTATDLSRGGRRAVGVVVAYDVRVPEDGLREQGRERAGVLRWRRDDGDGRRTGARQSTVPRRHDRPHDGADRSETMSAERGVRLTLFTDAAIVAGSERLLTGLLGRFTARAMARRFEALYQELLSR
jgi:hypothetical protein